MVFDSLRDMFTEDRMYDVAQTFQPSLPLLLSEEVSITCGGQQLD